MVEGAHFVLWSEETLIFGFYWPLLYCDLSPPGFGFFVCKEGNGLCGL